MAYYWELDLYFDAEGREPPVDSITEREQDWEECHYYGRLAYRYSITVDKFESGASGTLALYQFDEDEDGTKLMKHMYSIRDPGLIGFESTRRGEPDPVPEPEEAPVPEEEWEQDAQ